MSKNSAQDTGHAGAERLVLVPPNFTPDEDGVVWVCGFRKREGSRGDGKRGSRQLKP